MLFERMESKGLAHYSYLVGDGQNAIVIDPRRDVDLYLEKAYPAGMKIGHILETHVNEDYVIGSRELAARTGAEIWHADSQEKYGYGQAVTDGQVWRVGSLKIRAMSTPGHTPGSMSYVLHDANQVPVMLFCGDVLFAGEVGRVDLFGRERMEEMAGLLYDSIFEKIVPLGDDVVLCPAHGAGSVCGDNIADRPWTTIGLERRTNPRLRFRERGEFVRHVARELERPPYFRRMEMVNREGPAVIGVLPQPKPLSPGAFLSLLPAAEVLDTRSEFGFSSAHVPGALSIWLEGVPAFAGWFLSYDRPVLLVSDDNMTFWQTRYLLRLGFDNLAGFLSGGMHAWHTAGFESRPASTMTVQELCRQIDAGGKPWILDVRSAEEAAESGSIPDAHGIPITSIPERMRQVPQDTKVYIFCGSGLRSMTVASLLQRHGWTQLTVILGGTAGWKSAVCPLSREQRAPSRV